MLLWTLQAVCEGCTCSCLAKDMPLLADLIKESPRKRCTSAKDLSLLAVKGLPERWEEKEAFPEGPGAPPSSSPDESSQEWVMEVARLRLAMMRAVGSASDAGRDEDFSSLALGVPVQAASQGLGC